MKIPCEQLSKAALRGVVEDFVLREGTDYGAETSLEVKIDQVMAQLKAGTASVVYDDVTETCTIMPTSALPTSALF
jgi:uncharacterized protein YheU (UPF0270 family)